MLTELVGRKNPPRPTLRLLLLLCCPRCQVLQRAGPRGRGSLGDQDGAKWRSPGRRELRPRPRPAVGGGGEGAVSDGTPQTGSAVVTGAAGVDGRTPPLHGVSRGARPVQVRTAGRGGTAPVEEETQPADRGAYTPSSPADTEGESEGPSDRVTECHVQRAEP